MTRAHITADAAVRGIISRNGDWLFCRELPVCGRKIHRRNSFPLGITRSRTLIQTGKIKMRGILRTATIPGSVTSKDIYRECEIFQILNVKMSLK
jgi:hypothetical protein